MSHKSILTFAVFLNAALLHAQIPVRGTVQDPQGKMVDGAKLVLYSQGASTPLARTRSQNGEFVFPDSGPG